ncbi:MAG: type III secretion chaperone SycN [Deltaproteobacteria bacterium]|jgi:type III secretion system chaperone SycN|nr:type III secretion chaperone SycN [Deltaproteobacteria bacterium]
MSQTHVIAEFIRRMGLPDLAFAPGKPVQLFIQGMGTLFIEDGEGEILLYLARSFPAHDRDVPRRALELCRPALARPFPVYAGLYKQTTLVFLTRFSRERFSVQSLEQTVAALSGLLDQAVQ